MWRMALGIFTSTGLMTSPNFWEHRPSQGALAAVAGLVGVPLAVAAVSSRGAAFALALAGGVVGLSTFFLPDTLATAVSHVVAGGLMVIAGLSPEAKLVSSAGRDAITPAAPHVPQAEPPRVAA